MQACVGRVEVLPGSGARLLEGIRNSIRLFGMSPSHHTIEKEMPIQLTDHMYIYIYIYIYLFIYLFIYLHIHMLYYILSCHVIHIHTFFSQNTSVVASWAPAAQGPSHDATFYARSLQED